MDTQVTSSQFTTEPHRAAALPVANLFNKASHHPSGEASQPCSSFSLPWGSFRLAEFLKVTLSPLCHHLKDTQQRRPEAQHGRGGHNRAVSSSSAGIYKMFCSQWHHGVQGERQPAQLQHLSSAQCGAGPATAGSVLLLGSAPEGDAESRPQHTGKTSPPPEHISWNCQSISLSARTLTPGDVTCEHSTPSVGCFSPFSPLHSPWTREFAIAQQSFSFVVCKLE